MVQPREAMAVKDDGGLMGLILRLRTAGIFDKSLLAAVEATPRERFAPAAFFDIAYSSRSLPIECGQNMTGCDTVIRIVQALDPASSHSVLEIGTGSGYQTALLARIAKKVFSVERYRTLSDLAGRRLEDLKINNAPLRIGDGREGLPGEGVYDRIVANGSYEEVPRHFIDQLTAEGVLVAPIGPAFQKQMLVKFTRIGNRFDRQDLFPVRFSPLETGAAQAL